MLIFSLNMSSDVVTIFIVLILTDEQQQVWVESDSNWSFSFRYFSPTPGHLVLKYNYRALQHFEVEIFTIRQNEIFIKYFSNINQIISH